VIIPTDASDYVSAEDISRRDDAGVLLPVAHCLEPYAPVECDYDRYDKELLAIVNAFEERTPKGEGALHLLQFVMDRKKLKYFITKQC